MQDITTQPYHPDDAPDLADSDALPPVELLTPKALLDTLGAVEWSYYHGTACPICIGDYPNHNLDCRLRLTLDLLEAQVARHEEGRQVYSHPLNRYTAADEERKAHVEQWALNGCNCAACVAHLRESVKRLLDACQGIKVAIQWTPYTKRWRLKSDGLTIAKLSLINDAIAFARHEEPEQMS